MDEMTMRRILRFAGLDCDQREETMRRYHAALDKLSESADTQNGRTTVYSAELEAAIFCAICGIIPEDG